MINERYDNSLKTYVIFLLGILFLSFTAPWQKMGNFDPATGAFLRVLGGALFLIPFAIR
ncbi:EamA family transporter, partial [Salmonella enterica subsp. enterica]|nr:EamA family transporter [Salmonella enterica subsp. enterica serovar Java]